MKKKLLLFILIFISFRVVKSQSWCPTGATWYPGVWSGFSGYDAVVEYKYTHDTLIQNKNCKIIKGTFIGQNMPDFGNLNYTVVPNYRTYYTYENNNTIYLFQNNSFDTVVNFNAQIGDKWLALRCPGGAFNQSYEITDTSHVLINNISLKSLTASYTTAITNGTLTQTYTLNTIFTERMLGSIVRWGDLFGRGCFDIPHTGDLNQWPQNCGYRDFEISTISTIDGFCNKFTRVNETKYEINLVSLFPNPSEGDFTLKLTKAANLKIFNSIGYLVHEEYINNADEHLIHVDNLPKGIYHINLQNNSSYKNFKLVIK